MPLPRPVSVDRLVAVCMAVFLCPLPAQVCDNAGTTWSPRQVTLTARTATLVVRADPLGSEAGW